MTSGKVLKVRRTAKADPRLELDGLFDPEVNRQLAETLPLEAQGAYFNRATMPSHWLEATLENQPSYRQREKSVALNFEDLPATMVTEFAWSVERQVALGMRIQAQNTCKLTRQIARVLAEPGRAKLRSLLDMPRDEWLRAIRKARTRNGKPISTHQMEIIGRVLGRVMDLLAHAYHQGDWWELNVWNPLLDTRIPIREHEPCRTNLIYFSHLTTPWLREAAKWWLSRGLEREVYTWSTLRARQHSLIWFQRYLDLVGCDGPHLQDDQRRLGPWVQDFRTWLRRQKATVGRTKGQPLGPSQSRSAMTAPEQFYRFMFEEQDRAAEVLGERRWLRLGPQHAALFRYGDKPTGPKAPPPDAILSDAVITRIAEESEMIAQPTADGGLGDEQLLRILGLLIKTGRRVSEICMLDYDPLVATPFPDPDGHVARLRYQQTKIITDHNTILVDQETVDLIRQQQAFARAFMTEQSRPGTAPKYLFLAQNNNRNGDRHYPTVTTRARLDAFATAIDLRDELGKQVILSRTHNFRHTKATGLLAAGVPIHVAMRYMGHKTPGMFLHYAQTLAETAEKEFLRYTKITADGREYRRDRAEMFEALSLDQRTDRILPNGWCTLPPRQVCDKGNACLSCKKFVTDETFAPALSQQRADTLALVERRQKAHAERFGEPMTPDNIWLRGRREEVDALDAVLLAIDGVRDADGSITPLRGAGAPQNRIAPTSSEDQGGTEATP